MGFLPLAPDLFANDDVRDAAKPTADLAAIATEATDAASKLLQIASAALDALRAVDARQSEPNVTTEVQDAWRGVYAGGPPPHPPRLATSPPSLIIPDRSVRRRRGWRGSIWPCWTAVSDSVGCKPGNLPSGLKTVEFAGPVVVGEKPMRPLVEILSRLPPCPNRPANAINARNQETKSKQTGKHPQP